MNNSPDLWPNGRCGTCGNGLNEQGACVNVDCGHSVLAGVADDLGAVVRRALDLGMHEDDLHDIVDQAIEQRGTA